jgi:hypothetical protein
LIDRFRKIKAPIKNNSPGPDNLANNKKDLIFKQLGIQNIPRKEMRK